MKLKKKFKWIFTLLLVCSCLLVPISAQEQDSVFDDTGIQDVLEQEPNLEANTGSITIKLTDTAGGRAKNGVKFGVTKVADIKKGEYVTIDSYAEAGVDFNAIKKANEMETAARSLRKIVTPENTIMTNESGVAEVKDLSVGVYLVYVMDVAGYENITPFLIAIPTFDNIDKEMIYDVTVLPKHSPLPDVEVNKVDSKTNKNITNRDFEFTMYSDAECTNKLETVKGDKKKGVATFQEVTFGTFYIKETKAPKGYKLSDEVVKVVIDDTYDTSNKQTKSIVYQNTPLDGGIKTGDNTNTVFLLSLLGGSVLMMIFVGIKANKAKAA